MLLTKPKKLPDRRKGLVVGVVLMALSIGVLATSSRDSAVMGGPLAVIAVPFQAVVSSISGVFGGVFGTSEEARLRKELEGLRQELTRVKEFEAENKRLKELLNFKETIDLNLLPSRVVGRSSTAWYRSLVLDKGLKDGVMNGSAVVTGAGVVGRVYDVTSGSSRVLLLTDASSAVDALIQRTRSQLVVEGNLGPDPRIRYLARGAPAEVGDYVITSGLDGIYPKGLLLGEIANLKQEPGDIFQTAILKPSVDFSRIEEAFIILPGVAR